MSGGLKLFIRPTVIVSLLAVASQGLGFATQIVVAGLFGAQSDMDAYLAAYAIPQYLIAALLTSLGVVFIPVFVDYKATGREEGAWELASTLINLCLLGLGALVVLGMLFPDPILRLTAPGLPSTARQLAGQVAAITLPTVVATGLCILLTGIYQSQARFGLPALAPVLASLTTLGLIILLAIPLGVIGLAMATMAGLGLQTLVLLPIVLQRGRYRMTLNLRHPAVVETIRLIVPLAMANIVSKATTLVERFLASSMATGSISDLAYAFRLWSTLALLVSTGITTVVFPLMATNVSRDDVPGLKRTMSSGLRFMWLAVAPAITLGFALALPLVTIVFQRGRFNPTDTIAVAEFFRVYLLALGSGCLGGITASGFYVLKETRTIALLSGIESVAYVLYTALLANWLGAIGIALGFVILFNGSLTWQILIFRAKTGNAGGARVLRSFVRTGGAALLGGGSAWSVAGIFSNVWLQFIAGGLIGIAVYMVMLFMLKSPEAAALYQMIVARLVRQKSPANS